MPSVCEENPVEHAVRDTKNAAQACDTGGGQGSIFPARGTGFSKQMLGVDAACS
jgi:hypothetical protein